MRQAAAKTWWFRFILMIITVQFLFSGVPLDGYCGISGESALRAPNARNRNLAGLSRDLFPGGMRDGGTTIRTFDMLEKTIREKKLSTGHVQVDWNTLERVPKNTPLFKALLSLPEVEDFIVTTHKGRPADDIKDLTQKYREEGDSEEEATRRAIADVVANTSLAREVEECRNSLEQEGLGDVIVELLPYDLSEAGERIADIRRENPGKKLIFVMQNIRTYLAEESKDEAVRREFERRLISLTGKEASEIFCINDAFDKIHRPKNASLEMVALISEVAENNIAAGLALAEDLRNVKEFRDKVERLMLVANGGKKFDKFKYMARFLIEDSGLDKEGKMAVLGALTNPVLVEFGKDVGASLMPKEKDMGAVKKGFEAINKNMGRVILPEDFIVEGREGYYSELSGDMKQVDAGPKTLAKLVNFMDSLGRGDGIILNGGTGIFDKYPAGTFALIEAASEAAERGAAVIFAGGDMNEAVELYLAAGKNLSSKVFRSTGGGALFELLLAENLEDLPLARAYLIIDEGTTAYAEADGGDDDKVVKRLTMRELIAMIRGDNNGLHRKISALNELGLRAAEGNEEAVGHLIVLMGQMIDDFNLRSEIVSALVTAENAAVLPAFDNLLDMIIARANAEETRVILPFMEVVTKGLGILGASQDEILAEKARDRLFTLYEQSNDPEIRKAVIFNLEKAGVEFVGNEFKDGGITEGPFTGIIRFDKNNVDLGKGPDTGSSNARHAVWADGTLINHSEARRFLEQLLDAKLGPIIRDQFSMNGDWDNSAGSVKEYLKFETGLSGEALDEAMKVINTELTGSGTGLAVVDNSRELDLFIEGLVRKVTNIVMREQLKEALERAELYGFSEITLCSGENEAQRDRGVTVEVIKQDNTEILGGAESIPEGLTFFGAYEPRWAIGTGKTPTLAEIEDSLAQIWNVGGDTLGGTPFYPLYGGSFKDRMTAKDPQTGEVIEEYSAEDVLRLPHCYGALIGGAGMSPDTIEPLIYVAAEVGEETGKKITYGLNWKATEITTDLAPSQEFVRMFMRLGPEVLKKVQISLGTPIVGELRLEIEDVLNAWHNRLYAVIREAEDVEGTELEDVDTEMRKHREFLRDSKNLYDLQSAGIGSAKDLFKAARVALKRGGLIVSAQWLIEGETEAFLKAADGSNLEVEIVGEAEISENLRLIFGNNRIGTAKTYEEAKQKLENKGIAEEDMFIIAAPEESIDDIKPEGVKAWSGKGMGLLTIAKALTEIYRTKDIREAFTKMVEEMKYREVLEPGSIRPETEKQLLELLKEGETFDLPGDVRYTQVIGEKIRDLTEQTKKFISDI